MSIAAVVSFRLGGPDGVSVEAAKWAASLRRLGFEVRTVAGEGAADRIVAGLGLGGGTPGSSGCSGSAHRPEVVGDLRAALGAIDLVVVENVCSLPLNPVAGRALAEVLAGRPAILHHHDLPWQGARRIPAAGFPPIEAAWEHVTINELSRRELAGRGVVATVVRNCFDVIATPGDRDRARSALGVAPGERVVVQPTRAIARKNVPAALALAEAMGATYWLWGPAEEGYGPVLERLLAEAGAARTRVLRGLPGGLTVADGYAAADAVVFPSQWEGFGNPVIESAIHRRPLAVARYPVLEEIAVLGFRWFAAEQPSALSRWLDDPDDALLDHNEALARRHFSLASLDRQLGELLERRGWLP
ncbi:MAG: glycosyltransferase [Acidimicrobiales bacterium]